MNTHRPCSAAILNMHFFLFQFFLFVLLEFFSQYLKKKKPIIFFDFYLKIEHISYNNLKNVCQNRNLVEKRRGKKKAN